MRHLLAPCLAVLAGLLPQAASAADAKPLLDDQAFAGASRSETVSFAHLEVKEPGKMESLYAQVDVSKAKALQFDFRVRYAGVKRGEKPWFDARIMLDFKDADGKAVTPGPPVPYYTGSSDWKKQTLRFAVPPGAATLAIMPALFQATAGTFDIDSVSLVAIDPASLPPVPQNVEGETTVAADAHGTAPKALHVDGNRILDADGKEMWLQGVAVPSLEWTNAGEAVIPSIAAAIGTWKANIIRLPVSGKRWFGKDPAQTDGGAAYRAVVADAVTAASSRGAWIIIDLHHYRAPTDADVEFWKDAAAAYKDNPAVLFGVLNEPHDLSWKVWRDGGQVEDKKKGGDALAENKEAITSFTTPGIQGLVAAVRGTGAKNIVVCGGLDWAYDLSGVLDGYALDDLGGHGVVYDAHIYPWKSDWQGKVLNTAEKYPVLLGEVGCDKVRYDFIPPERFENPYTWAPDMIACIQKKKLHWTAWAFHPKCGPPMLLDSKEFNPTPFWGSYVRAALLGAKFESSKLR